MCSIVQPWNMPLTREINTRCILPSDSPESALRQNAQSPESCVNVLPLAFAIQRTHTITPRGSSGTVDAVSQSKMLLTQVHHDWLARDAFRTRA